MAAAPAITYQRPRTSIFDAVAGLQSAHAQQQHRASRPGARPPQQTPQDNDIADANMRLDLYPAGPDQASSRARGHFQPPRTHRVGDNRPRGGGPTRRRNGTSGRGRSGSSSHPRTNRGGGGIQIRFHPSDEEEGDGDDNGSRGHNHRRQQRGRGGNRNSRARPVIPQPRRRPRRDNRRRPRDESDDDDDDDEEESSSSNSGDGGNGANDSSNETEQTNAHPPPSMAYIEAYLGPPNRTKCWLCKSARTNSAAIAMKKYNELMNMYTKSRVDTDPIALATEMADFFEEQIRQPANKFRLEGQEPIPLLTAADIYWHCRTHIKESSNRLMQRLEELQELGDTIYQNCLYKPVLNVLGRWVLVPRKKYIDTYLKVLTAERLMRKERPERLFMYSQDYSINTADVRGFSNIQRPYYLDNMPSYILTENSSKPNK